MTDESGYRITIFHCINSFGEDDAVAFTRDKQIEPKFVRMPCSSTVKDVFLLRAFEAGADAVIVLVCPEGACRYVEGNLRAKKRVGWVKSLLDEIGLGSDRLSLFNVAAGDTAAAKTFVGEAIAKLAVLGKSPAA